MCIKISSCSHHLNIAVFLRRNKKVSCTRPFSVFYFSLSRFTSVQMHKYMYVQVLHNSSFLLFIIFFTSFSYAVHGCYAGLFSYAVQTEIKVLREKKNHNNKCIYSICLCIISLKVEELNLFRSMSNSL